eukprot:gene7947-3318_t
MPGCAHGARYAQEALRWVEGILGITSIAGITGITGMPGMTVHDGHTFSVMPGHARYARIPVMLIIPVR